VTRPKKTEKRENGTGSSSMPGQKHLEMETQKAALTSPSPRTRATEHDANISI